MTTNKTQPTDNSVELFVAGIQDEKRQSDSRELIKIMQKTTGAPPTMWGPAIVGFGGYHYIYATGRQGDIFAVGFAARKAALALYGVAFYEQNEEQAKLLGEYTRGKGCLYIKDLSKVNIPVLTKMIKIAFDQKNEQRST